MTSLVSTSAPAVAAPGRYVDFDRAGWARLRASTPLSLSDDDLGALRGLNDAVDLDEVAEVYLPLSRLLNLHIAATGDLHRVADSFLGVPAGATPYVVGVGGSVAVGKSTTARVLQALLRRWPDHPRVDLVTTDGFLRPNAELERRGLLGRKGFPESYDLRRLVAFVADVKAGDARVQAPVYSHTAYDVLPDRVQVVDRPHVLLLEGLNVLQPGGSGGPVLSDYFDFTVYVDADVADIRHWYVERFLALRDSVFRSPGSYFSRYAWLDDDEARATAAQIWDEVNAPNLEQNIAPTRGRASLVLEKGPDHRVRQVRLRKV